MYKSYTERLDAVKKKTAKVFASQIGATCATACAGGDMMRDADRHDVERRDSERGADWRDEPSTDELLAAAGVAADELNAAAGEVGQ